MKLRSAVLFPAAALIALTVISLTPIKGQAPAQGKQGGRRPPPVILGPPAGVQPLATDLFTSKNFYKDQALWMDKRYYRCNVPQRLTEMWNEPKSITRP
jgi:hypothetical protein